MLTLLQSITALSPGLNASFLGSGGTAPYAYAVIPGGAGGTINAGTGIYTPPPAASSDPSKLYDTVRVTDAGASTATAQILVGTPLLLFCEIIQHELGLDNGRVYLWDQKINQPTDSGLYVAVSVPICRPFGNSNRTANNGSGLKEVQSVNMHAFADIDLISRGPDARDRKEEVILALKSTYCQNQQVANSFYIASLPPGSQFLNLSSVDGDAIPYRYRISVALQYFVTKTQAIDSYNSFSGFTVTENP